MKPLPLSPQAAAIAADLIARERARMVCRFFDLQSDIDDLMSRDVAKVRRTHVTNLATLAADIAYSITRIEALEELKP